MNTAGLLALGGRGDASPFSSGPAKVCRAWPRGASPHILLSCTSAWASLTRPSVQSPESLPDTEPSSSLEPKVKTTLTEMPSPSVPLGNSKHGLGDLYCRPHTVCLQHWPSPPMPPSLSGSVTRRTESRLCWGLLGPQVKDVSKIFQSKTPQHPSLPHRGVSEMSVTKGKGEGGQGAIDHTH